MKFTIETTTRKFTTINVFGSNITFSCDEAMQYTNKIDALLRKNGKPVWDKQIHVYTTDVPSAIEFVVPNGKMNDTSFNKIRISSNIRLWHYFDNCHMVTSMVRNQHPKRIIIEFLNNHDKSVMGIIKNF